MSDLLVITSPIPTLPTASQIGHCGGYKKTFKHGRSLNSFILPVALQPPEIYLYDPGVSTGRRGLTDSCMGRIPSRFGNVLPKRLFSVIKTNIRNTDAWEISFTQWQSTAVLCRTSQKINTSSWQQFQGRQIHFRMTQPQHNHSAKTNTPSHPSPSCTHQGLSHTLLISLASVFF